jgi:hypothetical protein
MTVLSGFSFPGSSRLSSRCLAALAMALMAGSLAACSSNSKGAVKPCPVVSIEKDLAYKTEFAGNGRDLSDIAYEARIEMPVSSQCWYSHDLDKDYIRTAFQVRVDAVRGPKFSGDKVHLKYFVGVTGPGGVPLEGGKQLFDIDVDFSKGQVRSFSTDAIDPVKIFPKQNENGDFYQIYVGLDLTKDQLDYNKRNPRQ